MQCFDPICLSIICFCFASFSAFRQRFSGDSRSSVTRPHFWSSRWIGGSAIRGYLHIRHANKLVPTTEARFDPILVLNLYPQPCFRSPFVLHTLGLLKAVVGRRSAHACLRSLPTIWAFLSFGLTELNRANLLPDFGPSLAHKSRP